jgi:hypothetical protein
MPAGLTAVGLSPPQSRGMSADAPGVAQVGDEVQFSAKGTHVAGAGSESGDGAALDGCDALLGDGHGLGDLPLLSGVSRG